MITRTNLKEKEKKAFYEEVRALRYNKNLSVKELAKKYKKSERTLYRWLTYATRENSLVYHASKKKKGRSKTYPPEIFNRIRKIKEEIPPRSVPLIHAILKKEYPTICPSPSTIRKFVREQGLTYKPTHRKEGYIKFERKKPNDLWQIDIAGVQTVDHLGPLHLIGIIDDCSRFVVAAEYFTSQKGAHVIKVIRDAIMAYGRPNQILADNGTQFRNLIGDLGTKYSKLLEFLGVKPIFAKPKHPQTKGKLERFFGTVKQMFLIEARPYVVSNPLCTLVDFNQKLKQWVQWYNTEKFHRSLPNRVPPAKIFFNAENRVYRPLDAAVNWNRWLCEMTQRKVNKYNQISYKSQAFNVLPGYSGSRVDVMESEDKIEIYFKDNLITTHPYRITDFLKHNRHLKRKIAANGNIAYKGMHYAVDYKLAGKTVEIQEANMGRTLLAYLNGELIKTIPL